MDKYEAKFTNTVVAAWRADGLHQAFNSRRLIHTTFNISDKFQTVYYFRGHNVPVRIYEYTRHTVGVFRRNQQTVKKKATRKKHNAFYQHNITRQTNETYRNRHAMHISIYMTVRQRSAHVAVYSVHLPHVRELYVMQIKTWMKCIWMCHDIEVEWVERKNEIMASSVCRKINVRKQFETCKSASKTFRMCIEFFFWSFVSFPRMKSLSKRSNRIAQLNRHLVDCEQAKVASKRPLFVCRTNTALQYISSRKLIERKQLQSIVFINVI